MSRQQHDKMPCLKCRHPLDSISGVGHDEEPSDGDFTVCVYCGHVMRINEDLSFRDLTAVELAEIQADPAVRSAIAFIRQRVLN